MILLSFDIEEFDMPLEYKGEIPFEEQLAVSQSGLKNILDLLKKHKARATFFATVQFAENSKELINRLLAEGHELASHTYYHSQFEVGDLKKSKERLEELFGVKIEGLRMPRLRPIGEDDVAKAGYVYNSSLNPTFLPGRYNNLGVSRRYFKQRGVMQMPASVSLFRIPLFWLSFHNFPTWFYRFLTMNAIGQDGYLNVYFHPWEFANIKAEKYKLPGFTTRRTGNVMVRRFDEFLTWVEKKGHKFGTIGEFVRAIKD